MTGGRLDAHIVVRRRGFGLDVPVSADAGQTIAIMGPSGAGKSTLLGAIAGLVRLAGGEISVDGWQVASVKPRRHVPPAQRGVVLLGQDPRLFPHLTARENVAFGPRAHGIAREIARADADEWLWRVGLPGAGDRRPAELSGGQQQRVALARALATSPKLLLLDEPFTALDTETAADLRALLHEQLHAAAATTLVATHDAVDAAALAQRLLIVEEGRVSQDGPVREVFGAPATRFAAAVAGTNRLVGVARAGRWWSRSGDIEIELVSRDDGSLAAAGHDGARLAALVRPGAVHVEPAADTSWTGALRLDRQATPAPGSWLARIVRIDQTPAGARVHTAEPPVAVDVSAETVVDLALAPGLPVRLRAAPEDVRFIRIDEPPGAVVALRGSATTADDGADR